MAEIVPRIRCAGVAAMLGVSARTVLDMAKSGRLPGAARVGNIWTFDPIKVAAYIERLEAEAARPQTLFKPMASFLPRISSTNISLHESVDEAYERAIRRKGKTKQMKRKTLK